MDSYLKKALSVGLFCVMAAFPSQGRAQIGVVPAPAATADASPWDMYPNVIEFHGQTQSNGPIEDIMCGIESGPSGRAVLNGYHQITSRGANEALQIIGYGNKLAAVHVTNFNNGAAVVNVETEGFTPTGMVVRKEGQYNTTTDTYSLQPAGQQLFVSYENALAIYNRVATQCATAFQYRAKPSDPTLEEMASAPEYMVKRQTSTALYFGPIQAKLDKLTQAQQ